MPRRLLVLLGALALLAGACGNGSDGASTATTAAGAGAGSAGGQTLPISVDAHTEGFASSWTHFFPHEVTAHPGDTLEFTSRFTGEPHSVAFGTLVDEYLAASAKVPGSGPPPPEVQAVLAKLPLMFREDADSPDKELFVQSVAQPCYLATEDPPTDHPCGAGQRTPPAEVTGAERFLSSGFLPDEAKATFTLAPTMKPGTYTFMCLVHGPTMTEKVTVVDKATTVPGPDQVEAEGRMHLDMFADKVRAQATAVQQSTSPQAPVGGFPPDDADVPSAGIDVFPREIAVKTGQKVTWTVDGFHVIAFNAPEDARPWLQFDDAGALVGNRKSYLPAGSPPLPAPAPAAGGRHPVTVDAGTWDGEGFHTSGAPFAPDAQLVYSLAFSKPGAYQYKCLVHPDMEGTVKVT